MDYSSAIANDAGRDPWASSPQHDRSNFPQTNNHEVPPTSSLSHQPPAPDGDDEHYDDNSQLPTQNNQYASQQQQSQPYDNSTRPEPQRYHHARPQHPPQQPSHHQQPPQNYQQQQQQQQPQQPRKQYKLQAKITALERTGRKDPVLRFDVYTNLPKFRTTQFRDVRRTHSEFVKFADHLISSNPEAFVPAVPPPLTAAGVGTEEDEVRVKASMQRWLNTVCSNHILMRDEEMVFFVESDFGYSPVVRRKQPATGVRRKYIKQFAPPPDDTPELLEARPVVKSFYLGTMDLGQKVDKVVKSRRALGLAESDFGVKMGHMQVQETHSGLGNAYKKLGKVIQAVGDFHAAQGTAEATTLADPLQYHSSDAFIVKETLTNRHILLRELIQAQQSTRSKTSAVDRLKSSTSVKRDKVDEALAALDEARSHEAHLKEKTDRVTENLVQERREWTARTTSDLRAAIREYVMREIEAERRTLATLEQVRPDVRNIDASGGLSRLGREAHPVIRRTSLASSQGPKGDAWSGVPRRPDGLNRSISGSFAGTGTVPEDAEAEQAEEGTTGRKRATSSASSLGRLDEDDEDRIDARNAASRLAQTTF
ncbi:vacuolar protein sorting-associated protein Vps17, partial [Aureobasidium melanogenum]|uniref:Vacuolar protein sorting-associated protein 17 n=1 Tax=Aureobasidium melanogenum (strain CBS 110374) TaxID=1043003 RepID=A0A074WVU0_AURM1